MLLVASLAAVTFSAVPACTGGRLHHRATIARCMADGETGIVVPDDATATAEVKGIVEPTRPQAPRKLSLEEELDELYDTLELYDARQVVLEEQLESLKNDAEVSVQRTGAFWIDRLAQAKEATEATKAEAAEAEAKATAAELKAAAAEARAAAAEARVAAATDQLKALIDSLAAAPAPADTAAAPPAKEKEGTGKEAEKATEKAAAKAAPPKAPEKEEEVKPAAEKKKVEAKEEKKVVEKKEEKKVAEKPKAEAKKEAPKAEEKVEEKATVADASLSMKQQYEAAAAKNTAKGADDSYAHVAQFAYGLAIGSEKREVSLGKDGPTYRTTPETMPYEEVCAMSQIPEDDLDAMDPGYKGFSFNVLRAKLQRLSLPTTGVKSELITRYEAALRLERNKFMSWDSLSLKWVPNPEAEANGWKPLAA